MSEKLSKSELFDPALGKCKTYESCRRGRFCQSAYVAAQLPTDFDHPCTHPQLTNVLARNNAPRKSTGE